jgi:hypothetical protein
MQDIEDDAVYVNMTGQSPSLFFLFLKLFFGKEQYFKGKLDLS